ncbi:MAG: hypothetical protein Q8L69_00620 [Gallionellaceae bacterium]|nr:hypothetical protein [Gallionellaceae bacterium]
MLPKNASGFTFALHGLLAQEVLFLAGATRLEARAVGKDVNHGFQRRTDNAPMQ